MGKSVCKQHFSLCSKLVSPTDKLELFKSQLEEIKDIHKGNKLPSVHILGDFNFCDIVWPDRLSKSGSSLSLSEGETFIEILNDHNLEQIVHFPTRENNTLDLIITSLPSQFLDIQSPDRLGDHDIVSGTLKIVIPPIKNIGGRYIVIKRVIMNL